MPITLAGTLGLARCACVGQSDAGRAGSDHAARRSADLESVRDRTGGIVAALRAHSEAGAGPVRRTETRFGVPRIPADRPDGYWLYAGLELGPVFPGIIEPARAERKSSGHG